jgi:callose synthase
MPVVSEGKPENQNSAIQFTRGQLLQTTLDMNQDGYFEEGLKVSNMLQEFDTGTEQRPVVIVGL